jgi:5'-3' exonuclease
MLLLVDYSSLLYRAFFSMPDSLPAHAVHGFLNMLARLLADRRPARLAIAVDEDWRPAFRVEAIPSYKAHRLAAEDAESGASELERPLGRERVDEETEALEAQEALGRTVLDAMGFGVVGAEGFEADDVIATLAARDPGVVQIVSGDRDLFALIRDPRVSVLYPRRGTSDLLTVDEAQVTERYGIPGTAYGDFALLRGDPSDGLPGVRGIGEKTARHLIAEYGSLDAILESAALPASLARKIDASRPYLEVARRVVLPVADAPVADVSLALPTRPRHPQVLERLAHEHALAAAIERVQRALAQCGP